MELAFVEVNQIQVVFNPTELKLDLIELVL